MQTSSSPSVSGANSPATLYSIPNSLLAFSLASTSSPPPPSAFSSNDSTSNTLPNSLVLPSVSSAGMYGPPGAPLTDDFIDLDFYSAHLSDEEEEEDKVEREGQGPQPSATNRLPASFNLPFASVPQNSQVLLSANDSMSSRAMRTPSPPTSSQLPSSQFPYTQPSSGFPFLTDLEQIPVSAPHPPSEKNDSTKVPPLPTSHSQSSLPSVNDALLSSEEACGEEIFLMPSIDIASGSSMTSCLVNLLRGLNLLEWYTLEDLCDYLSTKRHRCPPRQISNEKSERGSASSSELVVARKKSASLPPRIDFATAMFLTSTAPTEQSGSRLVDYLLTCSHLGSSSISDFLLPPSDSNSSNICAVISSSAIPNCSGAVRPSHASSRWPLLSSDWRRGRSDGLVCVMSVDKSSGDDDDCLCSYLVPGLLKPPLSRLLTGKFLPGSDWCCAWAYNLHRATAPTAAHLVSWVTAWLRAGAVLFLTQLDPSPPLIGASGTGGCSNFFGELHWRHRLVFGVSKQNFLHLSNPLEVVSASTVLNELAKLTQISIVKTDLIQFWHGGGRDADSDKSQPDDDLSLLATQPDPRWAKFNVLGQVISTLRDFDESPLGQVATATAAASTSGRLRQDDVRQAASSSQQQGLGGGDLILYSPDPYLVIPSSQRPGFSLFTLRRRSNLPKDLTPI